MYSFLYEEEPRIPCYDSGQNLSTSLDYDLKIRLSGDYFSITGSKAEKDRLVCLGVAPLNIVELVEQETVDANAVPRTTFQHLPTLKSTIRLTELERTRIN